MSEKDIKDKEIKIELKLKRPHPAKKMRLGRHTIINEFREYSLNEKEAAYLLTKGGLYWFIDKSSYNKMQKAKKKEVK